jgi:dipeptidyl-peptidase-4
VGVVTRAAIGADGTRTFDQRYPAAGGANADVSLWLMDADGGHRVAGRPGQRQGHLPGRVDWAHDGKTVYVQRLNRAQTRLDMLAVDPATGGARAVHRTGPREELDQPVEQLSLPR